MRQPWLVLALAASALPVAPREVAGQAGVEERLASVTCGAQLVLLGELPSHGEARAFALKAAMVRRLVERCGFTTVIFEAPLYDFLGFQRAVREHSATPVQLENAIGRFWLAQELAPFREWLLAQAAAGSLVVGGMDDQVSVTSEYARATLPRLVGAAIGGSRSAECEQVVDRHLFWRYGDSLPFDAAEQRRLAGCARGAADALATAGGGDRGGEELAMLQSFAGYAERQQEGWTGADRDEAMARNLRWQLSRLPGRPRTIVWTATVHAARVQGTRPAAPLGARLEDDPGRMVSVGFTALTGQSAMAGRPPRALPPLPAGSLEAAALAEGGDTVVLAAAALARLGALPSRLFGGVTTAPWGDLFDLVVVFREELPPTFQPRP